jgi:hypothetical protein
MKTLQGVLTYESRTFGTSWEDRELGYLQYQGMPLQEYPLDLDIQAGVQRNSSTWSKIDYAGAFSLRTSAQLAPKLHMTGALRRHTRFPDAEENRFSTIGRSTYANQLLLPEDLRSGHVNLSYRTRAFQYGVGVYREASLHAIRPGWLSQPGALVLADSIAYRFENIDSLGNLSWRAHGSFHLGNWDFWLERESVLSRRMKIDGSLYNDIPDSPERVYRGSVVWSNRLVQGRLKVDVRWDIQWLGEREDFYQSKLGTTYRETLPKELMLDFEARMQISTFSLYTRIDNLNHTLRLPAAGYAPAGVVFRYGILWKLFG